MVAAIQLGRGAEAGGLCRAADGDVSTQPVADAYCPEVELV